MSETINNNSPVGIFDSGLGGLNTVKSLINLMPNENIVYFGDTGRVPYGTKGTETIIKYAKQDINFLKYKHVKIIIVACGTVSSVYKSTSSGMIKLINVLYPTCLKAVAMTKNGRIGIIGTNATISSKSYYKQLKKLNPDLEIFENPCPLFVPLIESGFIDRHNQITKLAVEYYLKDLKNKGIDVLILGCTHYPIISKTIADYMGEKVALINSGKETAIYAQKEILRKKIENRDSAKGKINFYVSDDINRFKNIADLFLGEDRTSHVEKIEIEKF